MIATETKQLKMATVKTKQLKDAITKSIGGKSPYEDVLLKVASGSNILEVITADDNSYLSLFVDITDSDCDLSVPVNKKSLANILKNIKDDTITLLFQEDEDAEYLVIKTEKANYRVKELH
jgi:DNA polymerase III sliding clamp (beta) subunit (PCNA family)